MVLMNLKAWEDLNFYIKLADSEDGSGLLCHPADFLDYGL